jgi:hypothetical protein
MWTTLQLRGLGEVLDQLLSVSLQALLGAVQT